MQTALPLQGLLIGLDPGHQARENAAPEPMAPGSLLPGGSCPLSSAAGIPHCRAPGRGSRPSRDPTDISLGRENRSQCPGPPPAPWLPLQP